MLQRRWKIVIAAAALLVAVPGGFAVYQQRPLSVRVLQPEDDVTIKVFGLGTVEARVLSKVGFKVAGTLTELHADHGDRVAAGQMLARIESSEQTARVAKARAQVLSAEAAVQVAQAAARKADALVAQRSRTNARRQALVERQAVSVETAEDAQHNENIARADLQVAESEVASASAKLDDARAQYQLESVVLGQHELRAPFEGVVVARAKELGSVTVAGEALFTLVVPETVWTLAYVDEARSGGIDVGQPVEIKLRSLPQQVFKGRVARIGIESDRVNEERRVYVACENCPEDFYLGEQAEVFITTGILPRALMVPESAVEQYDGKSGTVWTIVDGRLTRSRVTLGRRSVDGRIEIVAGLPAGAAVAAATSSAFREGRSARAAQGPAQ
jgi:HlyD family secretion protein